MYVFLHTIARNVIVGDRLICGHGSDHVGSLVEKVYERNGVSVFTLRDTWHSNGASIAVVGVERPLTIARKVVHNG